MCYYVSFVDGVVAMNTSLNQGFEADATNTIYYVFTLMNLQVAYTNVKEEDRTNAVLYSMLQGPGNSALAAYWTGKYNIDSTQGDTVTQQWQAMSQSDQSEIGSDLSAIQGNLSSAQNLASSLSTCNGFILSMR